MTFSSLIFGNNKFFTFNRSFKQFKKALLEYRNTPRFDGLSPAQWFFGRRQRTEAVALPSAYDRINDSEISEHESRRREEMEKRKINVDQSSKSLPALSVGTQVIVQNPITKRWDSTAVITKKRNDRSYTIRNESGKFYLRNRKFLRPKNQVPIHSVEPALEDSSRTNLPQRPILKQKHHMDQPLRRSTRVRRIRFSSGPREALDGQDF